jgi:DNA/RNA endonuclease YhcR with UshA esterase domain
VTDKVERVNKAGGGNIFMSLGSRDRDSAFTVFIGASDADAVGDVEKYEGKTITVSGRITSFKDKPQIQVTSADQITLKDEGEKGSDGDRASPSPSPKK